MYRLPLVTLGTAAVVAWSSVAVPQGDPVAATETVVSARVVDANGNVVADLTADDFDVQVDGTPRRVTSASYDLAATSVEPSTILVVVDRPNLRVETSRGVLDGAATFVEGLVARHAVGLMVLPDEKLTVPVGRSQRQVAQRLRALVGGYHPRMSMGEDELSARSAVHRMISAMSTVPGRRTVVLLADRMYGGASTQDVVRRAALQGVVFYVIASDSPMRTSEDPVPTSGTPGGISDGLADLADGSGGALLRRAAGAGTVFEQLVRELSGRYLVTFATEPSDAGLHTIRVTVKRSNLRVRAQREFVK